MAIFNLNNFDADNFDASNFNGPTGSGQNLSQVAVKATNNNSGATNTIELFNVLRPIWEVSNANVTDAVPGIFSNITLTEGTPNTIILATRAYFEQDGDLVIGKSSGNGSLIQGTTVPYVTLCKGIAAGLPFNVTKLRYSYTSDSQLDQEIVIFKRTIFGAYSENRISPRSYFDPNQQQSKVVDIPISFGIDAETGIQTTLLASEVVTFNFFVDRQTKPTI